MWPFEDSFANKLRNQDILKKYREWLRKWLYQGNKFNASAVFSIVLAIALLSAVGFYTWNNSQTNQAIITNNTNQVTEKNYQKEPAANQTQSNESNQSMGKPEENETAVPLAVNPEELVKPVMGHTLTSVGITFSEVFQDYRYNTGVALAAKPGSEVKLALPGTVTLVVSGENNTQTVSINHGNGWESSYSGLEEVRVKAGDRLEQNTALGKLGRYERVNGVLENHLYFKLTRNGEPVDPNIYWK
ncbi:M23 family metallopeptidase [Desulforamulus aeronauticus]|uniref:Peptidase family M23 n=1 Tax=Desulforamulus aeronauticus DSM 10349 TaxID=1121421 RepID=A0A1M6T3U1_9FIRM|nr:M23 family metallopeptidase [Desulforamulus aeronauticus]SHK51549.1 Peptidase family M23 [Desulforamulus aeronauticus DSM 10349]